MNIYNFVNPSDPYTFMAPDDEIAALMVFSLGTQYGASDKYGAVVVPVFVLGGANEWYQEKYGRTVIEGFYARKKEVAEAMVSMLYGTIASREDYEAALEAITDDAKRAEYIKRWRDKQCSGLVDIAAESRKIGEHLLTKWKDE